MTCKPSFSLLLFSLLFFSPSHSKNHCPTSHCPNNTLPIQYPLKLQTQQTPNCTYTNIRCNTQGTPILDLPNNGEFYIRNIDYAYSLIKLYDPGNCLPGRLMRLNLSSAHPLTPVFSVEYTFYYCPSDLVALSNFTVIGCLSNSSTSAVAARAVPGAVMTKLFRCSEVVTVPVPVIGDPPDFIGIQTDFVMRMSMQYCEFCPRRRTEFVKRSTYDLIFVTISFSTIIMPTVICIGCCAHFVSLFRNKATTNGGSDMT